MAVDGKQDVGVVQEKEAVVGGKQEINLDNKHSLENKPRVANALRGG